MCYMLGCNDDPHEYAQGLDVVAKIHDLQATKEVEAMNQDMKGKSEVEINQKLSDTDGRL